LTFANFINFMNKFKLRQNDNWIVLYQDFFYDDSLEI
jgi:hypothetical protein